MRRANIILLCSFLSVSSTAPTALAEAADTIFLLCKGVYTDQGAGDGAAPIERPTQFSLRMSYAASYMELKASEWPALPPSLEDPTIIRSIEFTHDDDVVRAMFPTDRDELRGKLITMGLSKIAGGYKGVIVLERKTGRFTYPNTSGACEKVENTGAF
ncbi:hypothetical protein [Iodidimonas sp. SYSU 1G8]|uniref:hypothetical protein n=1 Tax=Iodidimonas sp. SYSU 1G8 TaxID=3133967 RepID=UPI0031FE7DAE